MPQIFDNHGRPISYLRLAVTDRCNLRCHYCMPEHGLDWLSRAELLTYEEMLRLCSLLAGLGVSKVRITGGEPFVRKDLLGFLRGLAAVDGLHQISLTTNGVATAALVPELKEIGIHSVNLSLDTLDRERFFQITRRDELPQVLNTLHALLDHGIQVKINAVATQEHTLEDLLQLAELTRDQPVDVRFIEEMPFNGGDHHSARPHWDHLRLVAAFSERWPGLQALPNLPTATATAYQVPGHRGQLGVIAAWSRTFCGTCNRIRVTPQGVLKTCLYDHGVLNLRDLMRAGLSDADLTEHLLRAFSNRHRDGWAAEAARRDAPVEESMATIGG